MDPITPWTLYVGLQCLIRVTISPLASSTQDSLPSSPRVSRSFSGPVLNETPKQARLLDAKQFLLSTLSNIKSSNPLAAVFEAQILQEIERGGEIRPDKVVGLARFDLGGLETGTINPVNAYAYNSGSQGGVAPQSHTNEGWRIT